MPFLSSCIDPLLQQHGSQREKLIACSMRIEVGASCHKAMVLYNVVICKLVHRLNDIPELHQKFCNYAFSRPHIQLPLPSNGTLRAPTGPISSSKGWFSSTQSIPFLYASVRP